MKDKIKGVLKFLWADFIAFSFPICTAIIFMDITGHSKGYDYDLGSEKDISIMFGIIELIMWLVLAIPSNIYVFRKAKEKGALYMVITYAVFILLAVLCIFLIGGWNEYTRAFNI